jgi:hypothetical protein
VLLKNNRKRFVGGCLAVSVLLQTGTACLANENFVGTEEIPVAHDLLAVAGTADDTIVSPVNNESASNPSAAKGADSTADAVLTEETPLAETKTAPAIAQSADEPLRLRGGASASPSDAANQVDDLTKQILLKEIELQRYNLHYTMEVAKQGRWKGWRYAAFQEINSGMGLAGSIISTANRGQALEKASRVKLHPQLAANYIPMIGSIIGASAAANEFGINTYHEVVARARGFSPQAAVRKVTGLKDEIDALLTKREALIKVESADPALEGYVAVDEIEGKILKDVRDQALMEFERFHIGARKTLAFQQSQYLFDVAKYTTNAIGCNWAYLSLTNKHRIWNGRAGIMFTISGQLTCFAPILSRLIGKGYGEFTKLGMKGVTEDAREASIARLSADLDALEAIVNKRKQYNREVEAAIVNQGHYDAHEKAFTDEIQAAQKKSDAAKLTATQNIGAGMFVGGLKTASGVLFLVPGFNPNYNKNDPRSSHVTNDLLFTSAILGLPSGVFSMLDTLRIQVRGEINRHKAAKAGKLPGQIAVARLRELDQMEKTLRAK